MVFVQVLLLFLIGFLGYEANSSPEAVSRPLKIKQVLYIKEKLNPSQLLKLVGILDSFNLHNFDVKSADRTIRLEYYPGTVNLAEIFKIITQTGYHIVKIE